jgi:spoIIIJ-associated protein
MAGDLHVTEISQTSTDETSTDDAGSNEASADETSSNEPSTEPAVDGTTDEGEENPEQGRPSKVERLENEGDIAADYLEELLDIADLDGDLDMDVEGDRAAVSIVGADLSQLVGAKGEVLDALQELTRLAVYRETGERSRLMLDISGYRAEQRERLVRLATERIAEVRSTGEPVSLAPMTSFERKVVHDAVSAAGLTSESEGAEPRRFVVILPA